jgi:M6 family metalloprotease-like protein
MWRRCHGVLGLVTITSSLWAADPKPADFDQYKTVEQAQVAEIRKVTAVPPPPGHFGMGIESADGKLVIARIQPGGAAEKAGVQIDDVLLSIDGLSFGSVDAIRQFLVSKHAGQTASVIVDRKGQQVTIPVRLVAASNPMREAVGPPVIGVQLDDAHHGVVIEDVSSGSTAEAAGIKPGDVIMKIGDTLTTSRNEFRKCIAERQIGDKVKVALLRPIDMEVKLTLVSAASENEERKKPALGVQLLETKKGVLVERVTPGTPAETAGIKAGDVICRFDGAPTLTLEELRKRIGDKNIGASAKVSVIRNDKPQEVAVELAAPPPPAEDMPTLARWDDRNPRTFRKPVYKLAVIPIAYPDVKPNEKLPPSVWETALFSTGVYNEKSPTGQTVYGSMNDYYQELSFGKFKVEGKVFEPVTVGKKRSDYTQTANRAALLTEACDQLVKRDGDDCLKDFDGIFFLYSGNRVQTQRGGIYWPHRSSFSYKGKRWAYFICPEGGDRMASISVISHEFGHMLGLPDLYARPEAPGSEGVGVWCTMSTGHGQDGKPLHFSAWCKEQMGWLKPVVIDPRVQQKLILAPVTNSENECYKVLLRPDGGEFLLLENRIKKGFDKDLPAEGLLIWRVVDGRPILEESHGVAGPDGPRRFLGSVPYPSPSNRSFTPDTTPSSKPSKTGGFNVHITDIRRLEDGRITFQIGYEYI